MTSNALVKSLEKAVRKRAYRKADGEYIVRHITNTDRVIDSNGVILSSGESRKIMKEDIKFKSQVVYITNYVSE